MFESESDQNDFTDKGFSYHIQRINDVYFLVRFIPSDSYKSFIVSGIILKISNLIKNTFKDFSSKIIKENCLRIIQVKI